MNPSTIRLSEGQFLGCSAAATSSANPTLRMVWFCACVNIERRRAKGSDYSDEIVAVESSIFLIVILSISDLQGQLHQIFILSTTNGSHDRSQLYARLSKV